MGEGYAYFRWHCLKWPVFRDCPGVCDHLWYGRPYWNGSNWVVGRR